MIKRSSKEFINNQIKLNPNWKILDVGCGYTAHENATVICDIQNLSSFYKDRNFIQLLSSTLPFKDKEFDFVIASHVIEHVQDVKNFIKELERVSSKGYIELPTILEDNLVFENKNDHIWHMQFDDVNNKLIISEKFQYLEPVLTVSTSKKFSEIFRQSLILELYWTDKIDFQLILKKQNNLIKFSRFELLRKFFSKTLRNIIRKN